MENRRKDKSQRATTEQVLDPRTRLILQKMLQRSVQNKALISSFN